MIEYKCIDEEICRKKCGSLIELARGSKGRVFRYQCGEEIELGWRVEWMKDGLCPFVLEHFMSTGIDVEEWEEVQNGEEEAKQ